MTHAIYQPIKHIASIASCEIHDVFSGPAVLSVNIHAFVTFLDSNLLLARGLNSGKELQRFVGYVAYVGETYRFTLGVQYTDGTSESTIGHFIDADLNALATTVLSATGLTITTTFSGSTLDSEIVPSGVTYRYEAKKTVALYGSVPTQVNVYSGEPRVAGTAAFDASIFNANSTIKGIQGTISYLRFRDTADRVYLDAYLTDSTQITLFDSSLETSETFEDYGITQHVTDQICYIDLTTTTTTQNLTKQIKKLYGSAPTPEITGVTGTIRSGGAGNITAFDGEIFWNKFKTTSAYKPAKTMSYIDIQSPAGTPLTTFADMHYTDNTEVRITSVNVASLAEYGITFPSNPAAGTDYIDLTEVVTSVYKTKLIYEASNV